MTEKKNYINLYISFVDTCSSWAAVGGGLGLYENYTNGLRPGALNKTPGVWSWLTSSSLRLGFLIAAIVTALIAVVCLIYHVSLIFVPEC